MHTAILHYAERHCCDEDFPYVPTPTRMPILDAHGRIAPSKHAAVISVAVRNERRVEVQQKLSNS